LVDGLSVIENDQFILIRVYCHNPSIIFLPLR
jgi:hypothetical protein